MMHYTKREWAFAILVALLMIVMLFTVLVTGAHAAGPEPEGWDELMAQTTAVRYAVACVLMIAAIIVFGYALFGREKPAKPEKQVEVKGQAVVTCERRPAQNVTSHKAKENPDWVPSAFEKWVEENVK